MLLNSPIRHYRKIYVSHLCMTCLPRRTLIGLPGSLNGFSSPFVIACELHYLATWAPAPVTSSHFRLAPPPLPWPKADMERVSRSRALPRKRFLNIAVTDNDQGFAPGRQRGSCEGSSQCRRGRHIFSRGSRYTHCNLVKLYFKNQYFIYFFYSDI